MIDEVAVRAFDMAFIIAQKSYEGYEYYDFFEQVFERLSGHPFRSNLTSEKQASRHREQKAWIWIMENTELSHIYFTDLMYFRLAHTLPICMTLCFCTPWHWRKSWKVAKTLMMVGSYYRSWKKETTFNFMVATQFNTCILILPQCKVQILFFLLGSWKASIFFSEGNNQFSANSLFCWYKFG